MRMTTANLVSRIGNNVQDTSAALGTLVLGWINEGYQDALSRCNWAALVDDNYTFTAVVGTGEYDLPSDFEEEIVVVNATQGYNLKRYMIGSWWQERAGAFQDGSIDNGTPRRYVILPEDTYLGQIKLDPAPDATDTFAMPYKKKAYDLLNVTGTATTDTASTLTDTTANFVTSGVKAGMLIKNTTDNTIAKVTAVAATVLTLDWDAFPDGNEAYALTLSQIGDLDDFLIMYGTGQAWAYKRQFAKADWYLNRSEFELRKRIGKERSKLNQRYQMIPESYRMPGGIYRLTGDTSYDSI